MCERSSMLGYEGQQRVRLCAPLVCEGCIISGEHVREDWHSFNSESNFIQFANSGWISETSGLALFDSRYLEYLSIFAGHVVT